MQIKLYVGLLTVAVLGSCAPRAYVVSPASADREGRMARGFASPTAVGSSSGAPKRVPSPEDKLAKQGSKPATERAASSVDFTAAIGSETASQEEVVTEAEAVVLSSTLFSGNESEHIKFSKYDPFGSDGVFELHLDGLAYKYPIAGKFSSGYGPRGRSMHSGVDLVAPAGTPIYAIFEGVVRLSKPYSGYGNVIVVRHENGLETVYSHNSKNLVRVGQKVERGQQIAECGRTGRATTNHLHFEVRVQGVTINPNLLIDVQAQTLQGGVLRVSRSSGGTITARRTEKNKPESPVAEQKKEVLAAAKPAVTTTATTTQATTVAAAEGEPEVKRSTEPASATASRGIRVGDKVYDLPKTTTPATAAVYHTVAKGETLSAIARKYNTTWQKISKINNWTPQEADRINAGKKIRIK